MFEKRDFKDSDILICKIESSYLKYMRQFDYKVPIKSGRKFIGLVIWINQMQYVVPMTSKSSLERRDSGKSKRSSSTTTHLKDIADILHNNMFPVPQNEIIKIDNISIHTDPYLNYEYRLIRKKWFEINMKSMRVYMDRYNEDDKDYHFLKRICCDFKNLENECKGWCYDHLFVHLKEEYVGKEYIEIKSESDILSKVEISDYAVSTNIEGLDEESDELQSVQICVSDEYGQKKYLKILVKMFKEVNVCS